MAAYTWSDFLRPKRAQMLRAYFQQDGSGRMLYVPFGNHGLFPFARRTYVVPAGEAIERILTAHASSSLAMTVVLVAAVGALIAAVAAWGDAIFRLAAAVPWLVVPGFALLALLPIYAAPLLALRRIGPLERGPVRSFQEYAVLQGGGIGGAWLASAVAFGFSAAQLALAYDIARKGHVAVGAGFALLALVLLPMVAVGPAVARVRRLRAENERLEATVAERTLELRELNRTLEERVREQVAHIERLGQLKHFFAAPVAEMILNEKGFDPSRVHRRELTAVAIDLRGFTAFSETSEPEEVIGVLRIYHAELGIQVNRCRATLEHFAGDGAMIFLNDPLDVPDHPMRALELAVALREAMRPHLAEWRANGFDIGLGVGIATGYATIGAVGYEGRWEYAAIGTVCNLAARLCAEAKDGQVVVSRRFLSRLGDRAEFEPLGERPLKGLSRPVEMFDVRRLREAAPSPA